MKMGKREQPCCSGPRLVYDVCGSMMNCSPDNRMEVVTVNVNKVSAETCCVEGNKDTAKKQQQRKNRARG